MAKNTPTETDIAQAKAQIKELIAENEELKAELYAIEKLLYPEPAKDNPYYMPPSSLSVENERRRRKAQYMEEYRQLKRNAESR